ncbi:hypothetical protein AAF712_011873 [Marasmius tenuissimus]|uniref:Proteophosphoglycan ppg4 n=1 Tax=Marasmius tenuissimus TaxID=585030 RepID=A0ABR2ZJB5_9AGAR
MLGVLASEVSSRGAPTWPFQWVWRGFTVLTTIVYVILVLARRSALRTRIPITLPPNTVTSTQQSSLENNAHPTRVPPLPIQTDTPPPNGESFAPQQSSRSFASSMIGNTGYSIEETAAQTTGGKRVSILAEARDSSRHSQGSESFHTAPPSRASLDTVKSLSRTGVGHRTGTNDPLRPSQCNRRHEPSHARCTLPLTSDNSHSSDNEEGVEEDEGQGFPLRELAICPPLTNGHSEDVPLAPQSTSIAAHDTPPSTENYRLSLFAIPSRPDSPIARPPTAASTTTAPPYSPGAYHLYRPRRDTFTSNQSYQTYETLPSYHSVRSTQTLTDMTAPPSTSCTNIRSLPPLPSLPPFASSSAVSLSPSISTSLATPHSPGRPVSPVRELERPE